VEASAATHCVAAPVAAAAAAPVAAAAAAPVPAAAAPVPAAAAPVPAAAAAASDKLEAGSGFPVEDVERRQANVEDFFLTEGEFVTRFDDRQICGGAGRLCDCDARQ
jgi:hypothetical protein